ncbi:glycerol-3-phosphate acyltransferase [Patescibacteria group bacterium]|nr:glycerol-3-phosphate acyltransferase [Patescibacteria group bacterium]
MFKYLWMFFSYLLGSIPFGFIVTRLSTGRNILEIGWRKTSGSNVFKHVGKWQGALSGILDVLKGYLAVFFAQKLGLSTEIQIFSGTAAVCGHNWSIFIKFAGGRGIGTFVGAFFALAPGILGYSIIPFILLAIIWNASIGTLLFFLTAIFLSVYFNQFEIAGIFSILVLFPVLIKRLSPIKEIFQSKEKEILIRNRLIFDNDQTLLDLRIKRILKRFSWW